MNAATEHSGTTARPAPSDVDDWCFLGVRVTQLTPENATVVVAEATLPQGASPPLHVHNDLDDSFYIIEGHLVVRCGDDVSLATAGSWIPFPRGVPHTFRVMDGPARVVMIHANDSFMRAVRSIGRPAADRDIPSTADGPGADELARAMAAHGMTTVGRPMEEVEARSWLEALSATT